MPFVTTKDMFEKSMKEKFAIGAFNINNMEFVQAIMDAAAKENSPVNFSKCYKICKSAIFKENDRSRFRRT